MLGLNIVAVGSPKARLMYTSKGAVELMTTGECLDKVGGGCQFL